MWSPVDRQFLYCTTVLSGSYKCVTLQYNNPVSSQSWGNSTVTHIAIVLQQNASDWAIVNEKLILSTANANSKRTVKKFGFYLFCSRGFYLVP